jgi:hypothetical protein
MEQLVTFSLPVAPWGWARPLPTHMAPWSKAKAGVLYDLVLLWHSVPFTD